jgi:flavin-binding protein dodecin
MSIVKVIEVLAESPRSWEEAAQQALDEASRSVRGIRSIYVKEFQATVEDGRIRSYRINAKITFEVESGAQRQGHDVDASERLTEGMSESGHRTAAVAS